MVSKEDKAFAIGVIALVISGLIFNLYFKISWFPTLALASIIGVALYFLSLKLLGD
jgi:hypothetical protein